MKQYLLGAGSALLLAAGGVVWWTGSGRTQQPVTPLSAGQPVTPYAAVDLPEPPAASEKTREEKRFSRYDKDKDGKITADEYLVARRKAFAKLDKNGDGRLSFEEYGVKTIGKFQTADADHDGALAAPEFATTRVVRKAAKRRPDCPPATAAREDEAG